MKRTPLVLLLAAALLASTSCQYGLGGLFYRPFPVDERVADASAAAPAAPAVPDPLNYVFLATADTHFGEAEDPANAAGFKALAAARGAAFVIVAGDLTDTGRPAEYARYKAWTAGFGVPVYSAVGNHDLYNEGWSNYPGSVGRSFYSIAVGTRTFYFLDSGNGAIGRVQMDLIRAAFSHDGNDKVIVCHYPLYNGGDTRYYKLTSTAERAALIDLYAGNKVELLLEGHSHTTRHTTIGPMEEWLCSSLAGSAGQGRCVTVVVSGGRIASVTPETY
jgi:3',5'-cyclic-AMP phosphodiesterase